MSMMRVGSGVVLALALAGPALPQEDEASLQENEAARRSRCARLLNDPSPSPKALRLCGIGGGGGAAKGDFNGDGYADLAIGSPYALFIPLTGNSAGVVEVIYGSPAGLSTTAARQIITGFDDVTHTCPGAQLGFALASGDFNDDGFSDLAMGAPASNHVWVRYGSDAGLRLEESNQQRDCPRVVKSNPWLSYYPSGYGRFGSALVWGDFNGDGVADLAVGAPDSAVSDDIFCTPSPFTVQSSAGSVTIYLGQRGEFAGLYQPLADLIQGGCSDRNDQVGDTRSANDRFGSVLTAMPVGGGDLRDLLVVGVPSEDINDAFGNIVSADTGLVHIMSFNSAGSVSGRRTLSQATSGVSGAAEAGDNFGYALAAGDFAGDGIADLAVGVPFEDLTDAAGVGHVNAGAVQIFPNGGGVTGNRFLSQASLGGAAAETIETSDHFGQSLAAGDFNGDGKKDLAIGVPGEDIGSVLNAGLVHVLYGSASGLSTTFAQTWHQDVLGILDVAEAGDQFGFSLSAWNFGKDSAADLAIGVPYEDVVNSFGTALADAGAVHVLYGNIGLVGLTATGDQFWTETATGAHQDDHFGWALY